MGQRPWSGPVVVEVELVEIERVLVEIRRGHDRSAVATPGRRHDARRWCGRDHAHSSGFDVHDDDFGELPEAMAFNNDPPAIRRPSRRVELRVRL